MLLPHEHRFRPPPRAFPGFRPLPSPSATRSSLSRRRRVLEERVEVKPKEAGTDPHPVPSVERWLGQLYGVCADGKRGPAVDLVFDTIDKLLLRRDVASCDALLRAADVDRVMVEVLLALLMKTFRAKSALRERRAFFDRVEARLRRERPQKVEALLRGMR